MVQRVPPVPVRRGSQVTQPSEPGSRDRLGEPEQFRLHGIADCGVEHHPVKTRGETLDERGLPYPPPTPDQGRPVRRVLPPVTQRPELSLPADEIHPALPD
jgi:hypothetical protein